MPGIPPEVLNRWPPDLELTALEVADLVAGLGPPDTDPDLRDLLVAAASELTAVFARRERSWPIEGYAVLVSRHEDYGLVDVSFCPEPVVDGEGPVFEIADGGLYANGPGVRFFLWAHDLSLVETVYMR